MASKIPIFLSYPNPHRAAQQEFIDRVARELEHRSLEPRTLRVNSYDLNGPLKTIRHLLMESSGLIAIAFRRTHIRQGCANYGSDIQERRAYRINDQWLTSPWVQIESSMAYQINLPILVAIEQGVIQEGLLERGSADAHASEFDLNGSIDNYFSSAEWCSQMSKWEMKVKSAPRRGGRERFR